jgi:uncharacterized protein YggU (UPF0235/DUF167 family)
MHRVKQLRYFVEVKFNSSGQIQVNGHEIIIAIKSEPRHGKANKELTRKTSDFFGVPENCIRIISGLTSRKKIIEIQRI